jgi:hypothetical protein
MSAQIRVGFSFPLNPTWCFESMHVNLLTLLVAASSLKLKEPVSQMSARRANIQSTTFFVLAVFMMGLGSVTGRFADEQGAKMSTSSASKSPKMLNDVPKTCSISKLPLRPFFLPSSPYPGKTGSDGFWFGKVNILARIRCVFSFAEFNQRLKSTRTAARLIIVVPLGIFSFS